MKTLGKKGKTVKKLIVGGHRTDGINLCYPYLLYRLISHSAACWLVSFSLSLSLSTAVKIREAQVPSFMNEMRSSSRPSPPKTDEALREANLCPVSLFLQKDASKQSTFSINDERAIFLLQE